MAYLSRRPRTEIRGPAGTRSVPGRSTPPERQPTRSRAPPEPAYEAMPDPEAEGVPGLLAEPDPEEPEPRPARERPEEVRRWRNRARGEALLGIVLAVVAILTPMWSWTEASADLSALVAGVVIIIVAIIAFIAAWLEWAAIVRLTGVLFALGGLWLIVAPVFVIQDIVYFVTHIVLGVLLLVLAADLIIGAGRVREYRDEWEAHHAAEGHPRAA